MSAASAPVETQMSVTPGGENTRSVYTRVDRVSAGCVEV